MIKSLTAIKHGYGSMQFRHVSHLTQPERDAVKHGETVYFVIPKTSYMQSGYKIVKYHPVYGYDSREPNDNELALIKTLENK